MEKNKEALKLMSALDLTYEEALEMLEFDKGNVENEEANKIEEKVKSDTEKKPKKKGDSLAKVKTQKAKKKEDLVKENLMKKINEMMELEKTSFTNSQEMTASKITFTATDGNFYSISLTKHKTKPDGYSEK